MNETHKCQFCGSEFTVDYDWIRNTKKYCSEECRRKANAAADKRRQYQKEYYLTYRKAGVVKRDDIGYDKNAKVLTPEQVTENFRHPKEKGPDELLDKAVRARNAGMTYGEYTSKEYAPSVTIPQDWLRRNGF